MPRSSPRRPPGRPVGGARIADRDRILDAAERVITRDGSGTSLEAIAAEAGVTKPIVYARVGSRAELSNALAERLADRLLAASSASLRSEQFDEAFLAELFTIVLAQLDEHRELFLYVTRGTGDDTPDRTLFLAHRSTGPLAELLGALRRDQGADPAVAEPWSYALVGMLNLTALWWMAGSTAPADVVAEQLASLVWNGLGD